MIIAHVATWNTNRINSASRFLQKNTCQLLVRWKFTFVWSFCESISTAWHVACLLPPPKKRMPVTENSLNVGKKDKGPGRKAWKMCKRGEAAKGGTDTRGRRRCTFPFPLLWALFPTISSPSPFLFSSLVLKFMGPVVLICGALWLRSSRVRFSLLKRLSLYDPTQQQVLVSRDLC